MKQLISLIFCIALSSTVNASGPERAKDKQAQELAECTAFYLLSVQVVKQNGASDLAILLAQSATMAVRLSQFISSKEVLQTRVAMAVDNQKKMINNDFSNISILLSKYKDSCRAAIEDPQNRYKHWLNKQ